MSVNMEVEKNTSKEVDTQLSASDSMEFNDDIQKDNEDIKDVEDSLSSLKNVTIDNEKRDDTIIYAQFENSQIYAKDAEDNLVSTNNEEEEKSDEDKEKELSQDEKVLKNDCKTEQTEVTSENSTNDYVSQAPLAFTIDFGNKEVDTTKYQNLFERYNARHKRNLSTSKVEINTKKPGTLISSNFTQKQKVSSTHSEGYFSSEDDTKRKTDQLSEKLKQLGSKSFLKPLHILQKSESNIKVSNFQNKQDTMSKSFEQSKQPKLPYKNLSLELGYTEKTNATSYWVPQKSATINDLSRIQLNNYDDDAEKLYTKNIDQDDEYEHSSDNISDKVSNINYVRSKTINIKESNLSSVSYTMEVNPDDLNETNIDVFNVSNIDGGSDGAVSEAGTYTIHKDYTDEEKARMDIDKVFNVGVLTEEDNSEACIHSFKMSVSRDNNTWISEWATQVAEHNSLPPAIGGSTGRTPPLSPSKIPSPIHSRSQRLARSRNEQSDSSLDVESYLRIKERIGLISNQHTLIDSGGESDDDTSNSYNTPPQSSQRTPIHGVLTRRGSLSESLFRRINTNENRRSIRKYISPNKSKTEDTNAELSSPSKEFTSLHLGRRSSSLDRRDYTSNTTECNTSKRNSTKYQDDEIKYSNSPVLNRLRPSTPKLTNSPIVTRKTATKILNSPVLERTKHLTKSSPQAKNIGYFTCVENSPYMLRKSNSTATYHEENVDFNTITDSVLQNSPNVKRNLNIQRSCSNANIRNIKSQSQSSRRSSFNSSDIDKASLPGRYLAASDSSSETGEQQAKSSLGSISSGIKLNRAFSIRRARLNCESDTTPNTTPEERRRRAQSEVKSASLNKQQNYHRSRTSNANVHNKESLKKSESIKPRAASISRTDSTRLSTRSSHVSHVPTTQRPTQTISKDQKKSGRSNSTLTSKEVEFQNWKRRKSYDPMKAAAEGRKKLIDNSKKHHSTEDSSGNHDNSVLRSASFHGTGGTLSLANEWSDNELSIVKNDNQVPPPCSPQLESDSDVETSYYLQTTQNVMSAMSARITVCHSSALMDSDNDSDEDTSHSLHKSISKTLHQASDTESSDDRHPNAQNAISNTKYNRAFRARLDVQPTKLPGNINKNKSGTSDTRKSESFTSISRTDSGRFSMRSNRTTTIGPKIKPKEMKKPATPNAREVEMQNWKRRKSYDPMKAAMEGRRKAGLAKKNTNANLSPSNVARSRSFHGSSGFGISDCSDEELVISADEVALY
ncbi:putative leucine-rich repeat-containing protein DDB_G0290503 isoform X3 [Frieseomelitta varia]|uniref:putative leucine-rich repeat-containing protein DDB_G0290503 isoform X3 n=1 Tax=Frieseomelitta varia TaxID=561572 RepID=UPI001CB68C7B|nr:putative leucine-rich repeat-containing protein DDB_G0290503 isoform X3 [Frieseomelitta varia]